MEDANEFCAPEEKKTESCATHYTVESMVCVSI